MTIALQRDNEGSDTIFFDAILSYSSSYNSKLSSHPIDGNGRNKKSGGILTVDDHVITENPTFSLKGIISGADFGTGRPSASEYPLANDVSISQYASVKSSSDNLLNKITGSLLSFGQNAEPEVTIGTRVSVPLQVIKNLLISIRDNRELITLVEFTGTSPTQTELDLVITSLQFSEDEKTGDSLSVDMTLQRANFVDLVFTKILVRQSNTSGETKDSAQQIVNKGSQSSPVQKTILQDIAVDLDGALPMETLTRYYEKVKALIKAKGGGT